MAYDLRAKHWFRVWQFNSLEQLRDEFHKRHHQDPQYIILSVKAYCRAFHINATVEQMQRTWEGITVCGDNETATMCYVGPIPKGGNE